ncbi:MAG TPA: hypothetical protein ENG09_01535 [Candidatus Syntrophoarchaeum butanivorans]|uniref:Nmd3 N-terminal domain-containing protein n=1 Tax=Candidatus Syntropharchaeum butanivorans TaxID=1839936 RepID=A0A7C0X0M3_9EURY|nr:hypothetical protein [Candidatus Syntrophoarchaeum butanivorans]
MMKRVAKLRPCPRCGRETRRLIDGLCEDCFIEGFTAIEAPPRVEMRVCPRCGAYYRQGRWVEGELGPGITDEVIRGTRISEFLEEAEITVECEATPLSRGAVPALLKVRGEVFGRVFEEVCEIRVRISREICRRCSRIAGGYYEAILQIRAEGRTPSPEEVESCLEIIDDRIEHHGSFVTRLQEVKKGVDVYIGAKSAAQDSGREIIRRFGGEIITSPKLVGRRGGKDIYRLTVLVRLPRFVAGDIVNFRGRYVLLTSISRGGEGIYLEDWRKTGRMDLSELKFCMSSLDAKKTVLLLAYEREIEVLDPETLRPVTIEKPAPLTASAGDDVLAVKIDGSVFLIPEEVEE